MKGSVYDVTLLKLKIVKSRPQKIKSQDQNVKLTPIDFTCYQNCLFCLGAMSSPIPKQ